MPNDQVLIVEYYPSLCKCTGRNNNGSYTVFIAVDGAVLRQTWQHKCAAKVLKADFKEVCMPTLCNIPSLSLSLLEIDERKGIGAKIHQNY